MPEAATSQQPETMGVIYRMPTSELHPHPDNPFGVRDDPEMQELVDSVQKFGVLVPAIARPRPDGGFELISGHRRKHASELAGLDFMPVIVLNLNDDEAIIQLVDSNIQRENVLPSERAKAYKMRMEAIKRTAGRPSKSEKENSPKISANFRSDDELGEKAGVSGDTIRNYISLTNLISLYTYGIELTKLFSDGKGDFSNVEFIIHNDTDNYFVKAELNEEEGVYYVVDHVENEADATHFVPVIPQEAAPRQLTEYKVIVKGLEDDTYTITEVRTDNGYTLLKEDIEVVISQVESTVLCDIYESDVVGLIQNDPRFAEEIIAEAIAKGYIKTDGNLADVLNNMPQKQLAHYLLTASATVDGNAVNMLEDNGSANAEAPLTVVNTRGFDLPETGDNGTMMFTVFGILAMAGAAVVIVLASRKKRTVR